MVDLITDNLPAIIALCEKHGVRKLEVFGSATKPDRFDPETSDVDFVIDFLDYGPAIVDRFFGFAEDIEMLLGDMSISSLVTGRSRTLISVRP